MREYASLREAAADAVEMSSRMAASMVVAEFGGKDLHGYATMGSKEWIERYDSKDWPWSDVRWVRAVVAINPKYADFTNPGSTG